MCFVSSLELKASSQQHYTEHTFVESGKLTSPGKRVFIWVLSLSLFPVYNPSADGWKKFRMDGKKQKHKRGRKLINGKVGTCLLGIDSGIKVSWRRETSLAPFMLLSGELFRCQKPRQKVCVTSLVQGTFLRKFPVV